MVKLVRVLYQPLARGDKRLFSVHAAAKMMGDFRVNKAHMIWLTVSTTPGEAGLAGDVVAAIVVI